MNRDKAFALLAYLVQALSTLGVVFAVSHFLDPASYGRYSLVVATSQTVAVFGAEWIRLGALRFCAADADDMRERVATIQTLFLAVCVMLALAAVGSGLSGVLPVHDALLGLVVAVLMGATDLQLVFLRVRGSFSGFAKLQCARAIILLLSATAGAALLHSQLGALAGLSIGYLLSMALFVRADASWWRFEPSNFNVVFFRQLAIYGMAAAGASMIHSLVPMGMRWTGQAFMTPVYFAGFSLAIDLLQRPFALVTSALGGILTPGVIKQFEDKSDLGLPKLKQLYEVQSWAVLVLMGGSLAFLPEISEWALKSALREGFLGTGVAVAMIFAAHVVIQTILSTPGHLAKTGAALIVNAVVEVALVGVAALVALGVASWQPTSWLWLVLLAVVLSDLFAARLVRVVPCAIPFGLFFAGPLVALVMSAFHMWDTEGDMEAGLIKAMAFGLVMGACGLGVRRLSKRG